MPEQLDSRLVNLLHGQRRGVLATLRRNGRPQLSTVAYAYEPDTRRIRISTTDGSAKVSNLRRNSTAAFHASTPDGWSYAVADASAELTAVADQPDDAVVDELVEIYRAIAGEHPDWQEFREAMVAERRVVLRLHVEHIYGLVR